MVDTKVAVENVNHPGKTERVDRAKYEAMRTAFMAVLPDKAPGLTSAEIKEKLLPLLPEDLFPSGETAGWWMTTVRLDVEAKGLVTRRETKPLRFHLAG